MTSTYLAGVFLTIGTYEGPQLVYHYYDASVASTQFDESDKSSEGDIEWSDEESSDYDDDADQYATSPSSRPQSIGSDQEISRSQGAAQSASSRTGTVLSRASVPHSSSPFVPSSTGRSATPTTNAGTSVGSKSGTVPVTNSTPHSSAFEGLSSPVPRAAGTPNTVARNSVRSGGGQASEKPSDAESINSSSNQHHNVRDSRADLPCGLDKEILSEMLTPPESMCNEKFLVSVDDCIFLGIPVHILESGTWRPLRQEYMDGEGKPPLQKGPSNDDDNDNENTTHASNDNAEAGAKDAQSDEEQDDDKAELAAEQATSEQTDEDNEASAGADKDANEDPDNSSSKKQLNGVITEKDSPMRMFHVSFALVPPITEAAMCEERVYRYILVPFVRMLRQEQASKNYVWEEVVKMQRACESLTDSSAAEQQQAMEAASELARALRQMCGAITKMDIARIFVGNKARAFQVPLQLELPQLPSWYDEVSPHAYVSTTNLPSKEVGHDCYECYGLLLLDDPEVIVQEIEVDAQGPVAAMIRNIDPTSSLEELARQNDIEIKQIINLVWSLVYWRRARIIIPIHARYTYSVSPLSPTGDRYFELCKAYHQLFPMMPPMQKLMALLSTGKPKPFSLHIPSTDHRHIYLKTLSWLLQKDLVVQLPTFALIVVTRKIKISSMNIDENGNEQDANAQNQETSLEVNKEQTSAQAPSAEDYRRRKWMSRRRSSSRIALEENEDSVIKDPRNASALEKRWLGQVAVSGLSRNPDLAAMFQRLTKYFNGKDCLEQVMIREKISREEMRRFLHEFNQFIVTYRHW